MPKNPTDKVIDRLNLIYEFIKDEICVNTRQVLQTFGLTHSQAFYVLHMLRNRGLVDEYVIGKLSMWCTAGCLLNDVYVFGALVSVTDIERAICVRLESAKGHKATIRPSRVADEIAKTVHVNPRHPLLLAYISQILPIILSNVKKTVFRDSRDSEFYVVDTCSACKFFYECPACETLKKKLNC